MHVTKLVGVMYLLIFLLDLLAAIGVSGTFAGLILTSLVIGIFVILLIISRQPQNRYVAFILLRKSSKNVVLHIFLDEKLKLLFCKQ